MKFPNLHKYEDEKEKILSLFLKIAGKKLHNDCWLIWDFYMVILYCCLLEDGWALKVV